MSNIIFRVALKFSFYSDFYLTYSIDDNGLVKRCLLVDENCHEKEETVLGCKIEIVNILKKLYEENKSDINFITENSKNEVVNSSNDVYFNFFDFEINGYGYLSSRRKVLSNHPEIIAFQNLIKKIINVLRNYKESYNIASYLYFGLTKNGHELYDNYILNKNSLNIIRNNFLKKGIHNDYFLRIPYGATEIADELFKDDKDLRTIALPNTIKKIGEKAFACSSDIDFYFFANNTNEINLPVSHLLNINIPDNVDYIGKKAFSCCNKLRVINLPDTLSEIEESVFENCITLTKLKLPNNLKVIKNRAFCNCSSIINLILPETLEIIGEESFYGCFSIEKIVIPDSVKEIQNGAFKNCKSLKEVIISKTNSTKISDTAFEGCNFIITKK